MCSIFRLSRLFSLFLLITALSTAALADAIRLKDGSIIKGRVTSFTSGKFLIEIGEGSRLRQLTFLASEVESIIFDSQPPQSSTKAAVVPAYTKPEQKPASPPKVILTDITPSASPVKPQPVQQQPRPSAPSSNSKPIQLSTKVLADNTANGWTNSGWVVKKGQRIHITGNGTVSLGKGRTCSPSGDADLEDQQKLLKSVPTGALLAVIGDDNNNFIYIGAEREFTAARDGALFLGINEGNLNDNSGAFDVKIEVIPDTK